MKKIPFRDLFNEVKKSSMTKDEKKSTWDGVFRRASDFPDGVSPFINKPSNWDGVLRRESDFPDGDSQTPDISDKDTSKDIPETSL